MDGAPRPRSSGGGDALARSSIIGDLRQRRVLSLLLDRSPLTERELAVRLLARERCLAPAAVSETDLDPVQTDLRHRCLPQLEAVGWIDRCPDGVVLDERPTFESVTPSPPDLRTPEDPAWDAIGALLARPYRADVVTLLANRDRDTTVTDLVTALRERHTASALPEDDRSLRISLHHVDLPKLASTGLVAYDASARTATPTPRLTAFVDRIDLDN